MSDTQYPYWKSKDLKPEPKVSVIGEDVIFENNVDDILWQKDI